MTIALVIALCVFEVTLIFLAYEPKALWANPWIAIATILAISGALIFWLLSIRVSLHPDGIKYQSWAGSREMRWDQVERFYYSALRRSINFIPVGTYYRFKLVDGSGNKISFGNRVEKPRELGEKLLTHTYRPLLTRAIDQFNSGAELDFGDVRLSREHGLTVKKLFRLKRIPLNELAEYRIEKGTLYLFKVGQKRAAVTCPPKTSPSRM